MAGEIVKLSDKEIIKTFNGNEKLILITEDKAVVQFDNLGSLLDVYRKSLKVADVNLVKGSNYVNNKSAWSSIPTVRTENSIAFIRQGYGWDFTQTIPLEQSKTYIASALLRTQVPGSVARIKIGGSQDVILGTNLTSEWKRYSVSFSLLSSTANTVCNFLTNAEGMEADFAQIQISEGNLEAVWRPAWQDLV